MPKLLIIADDFTGALDSGVQLAKQGVNTAVTIGVPSGLDPISEVLVVDAETRHLDPGSAGRKISELLDQINGNRFEYVYKKTDSTLRGNIGSELSALLYSAASRELIFVPAFPKTGRTTVNGRQLLDGVPLEMTIFGRDPLNPVIVSIISELIARQSDVATTVVKPPRFEGFGNGADQPRIYIFDAKSDIDLAEIARFLKQTGHCRLMAGCAGFAEFLPALLELKAKPVIRESCPAGLLIVNGSLNEVSIQQATFAEEQGFPTLKIPLEMLLADLESAQTSPQWRQILEFSANRPDLMITTVKCREDASDAILQGRKLGWPAERVHLKIAENLGRIIREIIQCSTEHRTVVVFGGDTALGIVRAIQANSIVPLAELFPGVVLSTVVHEQGTIQLITKAGGFGSIDLILKLKEYLTKGD